MSNAIICINLRFVVKNSGISRLASIFNLSNLNMQILQAILFKNQYELIQWLRQVAVSLATWV